MCRFQVSVSDCKPAVWRQCNLNAWSYQRCCMWMGTLWCLCVCACVHVCGSSWQIGHTTFRIILFHNKCAGTPNQFGTGGWGLLTVGRVRIVCYGCVCVDQTHWIVHPRTEITVTHTQCTTRLLSMLFQHVCVHSNMCIHTHSNVC